MLTFFCTCTHVRLYTLGTHHMGWGGDADVLLHLHTCKILHFGHTSHGIGWGGGDDVLLHLHTCETLHFGHASHGMTFLCTCTHVRLYTLGTHHMGWGGVGMLTFFCTCTHVRSVLQSTTPVLLCTTPLLLCTTKY